MKIVKTNMINKYCLDINSWIEEYCVLSNAVPTPTTVDNFKKAIEFIAEKLGTEPIENKIKSFIEQNQPLVENFLLETKPLYKDKLQEQIAKFTSSQFYIDLETWLLKYFFSDF